MKDLSQALLVSAMAFTLLFTSNSFAQTADLPAGIVKGASVEGITEYRLPNGLKVLLFPDQTKQTIHG